MSEPTGNSERAPTWRDLWRGEIGLYCLMLNLGFGLHAIDVFLVSTIMPDVIGEIGGAAFYSWASMLYMLASILGAASSAPMARRYGGKRLYEFAILAFLIGSLICALSASMPILLLGRLIQGFGGGLFIARGMAMVGELFPAHLRKPVLALISSAWGIAALIGPALGGTFAAMGSWRGAFWINMPLACGFLFLAWRYLPVRKKEAGDETALPFPFPQLGLLMFGVIALGSAGEWHEVWQSGLAMAAAIGLLAGAFALDARGSNRLFPPRPLAIATTTGTAYWIMFLSSVSHTMIGGFLPLALQKLYGLDALISGYGTAALALGWTSAALLSAKWQGRLADAVIIGGHVLSTIGLGLLAFGLGAIPAYAVIAINFLIGMGVGSANLHLVAAAMRFAPAGESALTASSMPTIRSLGISFGAAASGAIATLAGLDDRLIATDVARALVWILGIGWAAPFAAFWLSRHFVSLAHLAEIEHRQGQNKT